MNRTTTNNSYHNNNKDILKLIDVMKVKHRVIRAKKWLYYMFSNLISIKQHINIWSYSRIKMFNGWIINNLLTSYKWFLIENEMN